jgi:rhodanese-related sulfurtransferase
MPPLAKPAAQLVAEARARIDEIATRDLIALHAQGDPDLVIVDLRDIRERHREGAIPGAIHAPRGMIEFWVDPESPYHKTIFSEPGKRFVFHCAAGWRSALTVATLQDMGFAAAHLRDGFADWVAQGGPVASHEDAKAARR